MSKVRVRFAPSPSGHLHLGNVRTALFNWLFARSRGGTFVLRIEDTDAARSTEESVASVMEDLDWLGFDRNEGPACGGDFGPYRQSLRGEIYGEYIQKLLAEEKAYPCYCTQEELTALREQAAKEKRTFTYPGTCRRLTPDERAEREKEGAKAVIRLHVDPRAVTVRDIIRGPVTIHTRTFGDWIVARSDGSPTYNFAVVVDDALMGITHVIRGEDHLPNTPRQILLYESLGFSAPRFAHLPMILGPDSSKLSKRHGDVTLDAFRKKGMLPDALVNGLALLGWSDESGEEILTRDELVERFRLERVIKTGAVFDEAKLRHINREHMKKLSDSELADLVLPYLQEAGRIPEGPLPEEAGAWLGHVASFLRERIEVLSDTEGETDILWNFDASGMDEKAREVLADADAPRVVRALIERLEASDDLGKPGAYREIVLSIRDEEKVKGKALFHPLRVALTAATEGPDMETLFPLLAVGSGLELPRSILGPAERARAVLRQIAGE